MEAASEISGPRRRSGTTVALDGMSFTVAPGEVTGFAGPNGAGKSTTMRVILGLDGSDAGSALICGRPCASLGHPLSYVGSLRDASALQPGRSGRNRLLWLAHSQGLNARRVDGIRCLRCRRDLPIASPGQCRRPVRGRDRDAGHGLLIEREQATSGTCERTAATAQYRYHDRSPEVVARSAGGRRPSCGDGTPWRTS